jgi:hypothetical protein
MEHFRMTALLGPRQCGKTTLARMQDVPRENYFDLKDPLGHGGPLSWSDMEQLGHREIARYLPHDGPIISGYSDRFVCDAKVFLVYPGELSFPLRNGMEALGYSRIPEFRFPGPD